MKTLFLFLLSAATFVQPAAAQIIEHPIIDQLATTADVIAVARLREPQIWQTSQLVVMTGQSKALIERSLKGGELPLKVMIRVVRHLAPESLTREPSQAPSEAKEFPKTPATPTEFREAGDTANLENADKVIVFLRRSKLGTLSAIDGFLYALPYSPELEKWVATSVKDQHNLKAGDGDDAEKSIDTSIIPRKSQIYQEIKRRNPQQRILLSEEEKTAEWVQVAIVEDHPTHVVTLERLRVYAGGRIERLTYDDNGEDVWIRDDQP